MADFKELDGDQIRDADTIDKHLMSDEAGWYPITKLNDWEKAVIQKEVARLDCVGWYRNPSVSSADSLGVTYRDGVGNWRAMHPDFMLFNDVNGQIKPSIVDPHSTHLDDALVKLRGLAGYAQTHANDFHRIDSIANGTGGELRVLDLKDEAVRDSVMHSKLSAAEIFAAQGRKYA